MMAIAITLHVLSFADGGMYSCNVKSDMKTIVLRRKPELLSEVPGRKRQLSCKALARA